MLNSLAFLTNGPQGCASTTFSSQSIKSVKSTAPVKSCFTKAKIYNKALLKAKNFANAYR